MATAADMTVEVVMVVVVVVVFGARSLHRTEAAEHVVGGSYGWQIPPNSTFFSDWASTQSFVLGDTLTFNFTTGVHSVANVTQDAYTNCNTTSANNVITSGPANITLDSGEQQFYICTFRGHCSQGQKLAVNVSSTSVSRPSPPPSSASSLVATFNLVFMSIAVGFVFF